LFLVQEIDFLFDASISEINDMDFAEGYKYGITESIIASTHNIVKSSTINFDLNTEFRYQRSRNIPGSKLVINDIGFLFVEAADTTIKLGMTFIHKKENNHKIFLQADYINKNETHEYEYDLRFDLIKYGVNFSIYSSRDIYFPSHVERKVLYGLPNTNPASSLAYEYVTQGNDMLMPSSNLVFGVGMVSYSIIPDSKIAIGCEYIYSRNQIRQNVSYSEILPKTNEFIRRGSFINYENFNSIKLNADIISNLKSWLQVYSSLLYFESKEMNYIPKYDYSFGFNLKMPFWRRTSHTLSI
jgi:hypothetical protein